MSDKHPAILVGMMATVVEGLVEASMRDDTTAIHYLKARYDEIEADLKKALLVSELTASVKNGGA